MINLSIKIVDINKETNAALVKFASEFSQKPIDEYEAVAFSLENYNTSSPDAFLESIKPTIINAVKHRDYVESNPVNVNTTSWIGHTATFAVSKNQIEINLDQVDPVLDAQQTPSMINPEVVI